MSDSSNYSNTSDLDDIEDIDLVMQLINEDQQVQVLNHYPLFDDLLDDIAPVVPYEVNGVMFEKGYYLADGIYPQWAAFVKSFTIARDERNAVFKRRQESAQKDVERAFGVLQSHWHIMAQPAHKESPPAIVLEDDCLNAKDLTLSLMGRVKEMTSLVNLKKALCNEGFDVVKISYLGELWVLLEFETAKAKDSFRGNVGVGSWFSVIKQAYAEFVPEGRLVWVELDGVPFKFWSGPTFKRIAAKWGELLDVDDYDESNLHSKRICILSKVCEHIHESFKIVFRGKVYWVRASEVLGWTEEDELSLEDNNDGIINDLEANNVIDESDVEEVLETLFDQPDDQKDKHSEDPFGLYPLLNKENIELARKVTEEDHSLSHPPGFTPEEGLNEGNTVNLDMKDYGENERDDNSFVNLEDGKDNSESVNKNSESKRSGHSKYSVLPRTGGSILNLMEEVVKVGQTMGYNMDGCIKDITEIIESQGEFGCEVLLGYDLRSYSFSISIVTTSTHNQPSRLEVDGFDKLVRDSWNVAPVNKKNAIQNFIGKLKFLKDHIRSWLSIHRSNSRGEIYFLKEELRSFDEVNNIQASEIAQKAKIKWAIEGDENVKFFSWGMTKQEAAINLIFRGRKLGNKLQSYPIEAGECGEHDCSGRQLVMKAVSS
ncbi:nucleotide-binding alpha-beta plait domain-containing protein [Tanacetum coccineum]